MLKGEKASLEVRLAAIRDEKKVRKAPAKKRGAMASPSDDTEADGFDLEAVVLKERLAAQEADLKRQIAACDKRKDDLDAQRAVMLLEIRRVRDEDGETHLVIFLCNNLPFSDSVFRCCSATMCRILTEHAPCVE
jgi:hypothetical protein